jgi:hypothetical protein
MTCDEIITGYTKPHRELAGSILSMSALNGGGRSSIGIANDHGKQTTLSITGQFINYGKQDLLCPNQSIHYHATFQKGENTLEAQLLGSRASG